MVMMLFVVIIMMEKDLDDFLGAIDNLGRARFGIARNQTLPDATGTGTDHAQVFGVRQDFQQTQSSYPQTQSSYPQKQRGEFGNDGKPHRLTEHEHPNFEKDGFE